MKLRDSASLASAQIFQIEGAHEIIIAPEVLRHQMHLVDMIELGSFLGPVTVAHGAALLGEPCQHHNYYAALFPNQLPEISRGLR